MRIARSNRTGDYVIERLFSAHNYAYVCSPFISEIYAQELARLAKKGTLVKVLTSDKVTDPGFYIKDYFKAIKRAEKLDSLKTLVIKREDLLEHSKLYIIDDEYAVVGSANLTRPGMYENGETVYISETWEEVRQTKEVFEDAWKDALAIAFDPAKRYEGYNMRRRYRRPRYDLKQYRAQQTKPQEPDNIFDVMARELGKWFGGHGL
jgi:phosphatidylserine/phosphatidylglycerophosphate/cardiolipin synthase-like enzyme